MPNLALGWSGNKVNNYHAPPAQYAACQITWKLGKHRTNGCILKVTRFLVYMTMYTTHKAHTHTPSLQTPQQEMLGNLTWYR